MANAMAMLDMIAGPPLLGRHVKGASEQPTELIDLRALLAH